MKLGSNLGKIAVTTSFNRPAKGSVWFLHGTSDTGLGLKSWVHEILHREFSFKDYNIFYPTAPQQPYSLFDGKLSCVWYNRLTLSPEMPEDNLSIERTASKLGKIIKNQGIPLSKVIIGGFSLGGSMALHTAYRLHPEIAGCFVLSSCIPPDSQIYDNLNQLRRNSATTTTNSTNNMNASGNDIKMNNFHNNTTNTSNFEAPSTTSTSTISEEKTKITSISNSNTTGNGELKLPELFMSHGSHDPLIRHSWAKSTFSMLKDHGVKGHFYTMQNLEHSIHPLQLHLLHNWINNILDDTSPHRKLPSQEIQNSIIHPQSESP